jgi:lipopolysaccharide biosynthesis glycosyltransferase
MKKNLLVTLANKNYVKQAKALFSSAYFNAGWKGDYMLLSHEIPEKELKWFRKKGILVKKCKPLAKGYYCKMHPCLLDKFYLFTPEFKKWKTIIYLDSDIIVNASLDNLTTLEGFWAVSDSLTYSINDNISKQIKKTKTDKINTLRKLYNLKEVSFNAGVFVLGTKIIQKSDFNNLKKMILHHKDLSNWGDQLIMNLFFYKKWQKLPVIFNTYSYCLEKKQATQPKNINSIVSHFCGSKTKPWEKNSVFHKEWLSYLKKAKKIDLSNEIKGKELGKFKIICGSFFINAIVKKNQYAGLAGIMLKKLSPRLYKLIKSCIAK